MKTQITEGVNQQTVDTYLEKRIYDAMYWATFFPLKNVISLDAKTLIGAEGSRVAAHVISYNSKAPEAGRKVIKKLDFDIPKVAQSRVKDEKQILEHVQMRAVLGQNAVIEDYFDDVKFVKDCCDAREEWFALQALSQTKIQLSTTNNPQGIVNETVIDFGMDDANKKVVSAIWAGTAAKVVTDFTAVAKAGRALGLKFQYAIMNQDAFDLAIAGTELLGYFTTATNVVNLIDIETVNRFLVGRNLPRIIIVDTYVGIENKAGTITQTNPWSTTHVLFVPEIVQGNMFNGPIAEEIEKPDGIIQSKGGNVLISIQKGFNPVRVVTKGECNVFPSWPKVNQCINMYTGATVTWA